jgi:hypothetical protein
LLNHNFRHDLTDAEKDRNKGKKIESGEDLEKLNIIKKSRWRIIEDFLEVWIPIQYRIQR